MILKHVASADLVIMGLQRGDAGQPTLGELSLAIARETDVPLILIGRRPGSRALSSLTFLGG